MNDIDPAKMTPAERHALFASFTQGLTPAAPTRQTLAIQLAPWIDSIQAQRALGFDWKQLAQICAANLKIKVSPRNLQNLVGSSGTSSDGPFKKHRRRKPAARQAPAAVPAATPPVNQ